MVLSDIHCLRGPALETGAANAAAVVSQALTARWSSAWRSQGMAGGLLTACLKRTCLPGCANNA
eukprot:1561171-Lingulodinium_polyedra.AAC.1